MHVIGSRHSLSIAAVLATTLAGTASAQILHDGYGSGPYGGVGGENGWFSAHDVEWQSQLTPDELGEGATRASDCWGYTSPSGREFAIIGLDTGFAFVEVTDPLRPNPLHFEPGPNSIWRDVKILGHHAYGVSEAETGIETFDLAQIDSGIVTRVSQVTGHGVDATHNVVIDTDSGFLYRVGGGGGDTGLRMYDLNPDPTTPTYIGDWTGGIYIHDAQAVTYDSGPYAGRQIVFACGGESGGWSNPALHIIDVTDKQSVFRISSLGYVQPGYSHQGWLSPDRRHFFLDDELDEASYGHTTRTRVFDVQDLADPVYLGFFTNGNPAMDHNLYTHGDLIYEANYRSGLRVFRAASDPLQSTEVAWLDTYRMDDRAASDGVWANYPYFASGNIVLSDIQQGLIMARLTIDRVEIALPDGEPERVDPRGGTTIRALVSDHGVTPDIDALALHFDDGNGEVTIEPVATGETDVYEFTLPGGVCGESASVWIEAPGLDGTVFTWPPRAPVERATLAIATEAAEPFDEDFEDLDLWTVSGDATSGRWHVGVPVNSGLGDPPFDFDTSGRCALTWNSDEVSDVDGGDTVLTSPTIDASLGGVLTYAYWLGTEASDPLGEDDGLFVELSNDDGGSWQLARAYEEADVVWGRDSIDLDEFGIASDRFRVRFIARDARGDDIVEAAIDAVSYRGYGCSCAADINGDGRVDTLDFLAFLGAWAAGEELADWNRDGSVNTLDFIAYLNEWVRGC